MYPPAQQSYPIDDEITSCLSKILGLIPSDSTDYQLLHEQRVEHLAQRTITGQISTFYRGDNRDPSEIMQVGFAARNPATAPQIERIIDLLIMPQYLSSFSRWWKYPSCRPGFELTAAPFVATGLEDSHKGDNNYQIDLPMNLILTDIPKRKLLGAGLLFDGATPDSSSIFAIKIDRQEAVFLSPIPPQYIRPMTK